MNIKDSVKILTEFKIYSQILYRSEVVKYISPLLSHSRLCSLVDSLLLSVPFLFSLELRKLFSNAHCVRDYQKHCQTRSHLKHFQYRTRRDGEKNLSCDLYDRVGTKRRPKTQKRRPLQNRLEITLKWFEGDYRPTQKQETTRFAFINKFDQGLRFVHNPTKSTKRRPPQNRLEITSKWFELDCRPKQKRKTTRFAVINEFDEGLRFVYNPTKSTKRRPLQNCPEITSKWFERDSPPK